jgi:hypothetical protein
VNKQISQKFHMARFNLEKLNELEGKKKYRAGASSRLTVWKIWTLR